MLCFEIRILKGRTVAVEESLKCVTRSVSGIIGRLDSIIEEQGQQHERLRREAEEILLSVPLSIRSKHAKAGLIPKRVSDLAALDLVSQMTPSRGRSKSGIIVVLCLWHNRILDAE